MGHTGHVPIRNFLSIPNAPIKHKAEENAENAKKYRVITVNTYTCPLYLLSIFSPLATADSEYLYIFFCVRISKFYPMICQFEFYEKPLANSEKKVPLPRFSRPTYFILISGTRRYKYENKSRPRSAYIL